MVFKSNSNSDKNKQHCDTTRHLSSICRKPPLSLITTAFLFTLLTPLLSGCSNTRYFAEDEKSLGTEGRVDSLHHIAAYYPSGISLNSPGYLIGLEDSKHFKVSRTGDLIIEHITGAGSGLERLEKQLIEEKLPFISQVYRYSGEMYGKGNCALYNLYRSADTSTINPCEDAIPEEVHDRVDHKAAYRNSWRAIDILKESLRRDIETGNYTHLIVAMMGLDTPQEEAIRNFNSLIWSLRQSAGESFRPLIVGISWPSFWDSRWLDPVWEAIAYPFKADESDKLGLSWVGVIMHEVIIPMSNEITTVAITHSFGARSISMATCVGPAIKRSADSARSFASGSLHYLIGLSPAFSLQRFNQKPLLFYEDIYYPMGCNKTDTIVLTATDHDIANKMPFWADLAGNYRYYDSFCSKRFPFSMNCVSADKNGKINDTYDNKCKVLYIDTTELMRYDVIGTQGGAHSDIFRREIGHMIWGVISD